MGRIIVMCLLAAIGSNLWAQSISLNGKVTNQSGKAVAGAIVTLKSKNLKDTTDETGAYSIVATASSVNNTSILPIIGDISMNNGIVAVHLTQQTRMVVELFDIKGRQLYAVTENTAKAGDYQFNLINSQFAATMLVVRVTIGQHVSNFRYIPSCINSGTSAKIMSSVSENILAKVQAVSDSLQASALSYKTKTVAISSYTATTDFTLESDFTGTCTASKPANKSVSGSGPHKVVVETNSDPGIKEGTIYRPEDLGPGKNYPIYIWGEGACSLDGYGNAVALAEIASYGYFCIADGTPGGSGGRSMDLAQIKKPAKAYIAWALAENRKPCSAYYQSLDTTKVVGNGFSCGGFFGQAVADDPHTATWGVSSSGSFGAAPDLWNSVHTPVLIEEGNKDVPPSGTGAYTNGLRDFNGIAPLKWPVYFISNKNFGHGGDLWDKNGGHFTKINLAWMNWWLKGDTSSTTGKGVLVGPSCKYCTDNNWEIKTANLPQ